MVFKLNPFDEELRQSKAKIAYLNQQKGSLVEDLDWFNSNTEEQLKNKLDACFELLSRLRRQYEEIERDIAAYQQKRNYIRTKTRTILNPKNWFASDQIQLRRTQKDLKRAQQALETERNNLADQICKAERNVEIAKKAVERYSSFDLASCKTNLSRIESDLESLRQKHNRIAERKDAVDQTLKPVVDQMRHYTELKQQAENMLDRAATLDRQLSNADNSYERAMVHNQCEAEFGVGSPRKVIAKAESNLRRIARNYEKAYNRAVEIGHKAARTIDAIVIDGINLCYENNVFIGLSALEALIPILQDNYKVTVVFDAAIREMVKANDKAISILLGDRIRVHIVATKSKADETVLDLAESDNCTYILSNDRFGEYNDKRAILDNRVLRHEIVNGLIMVHDLGVKTRYRTA
ncbi:MAG: hypothetical protein JW725_03415 [Candidatus Babeliaceae bacterium]|nr:hypothetical protein [Candidatus Babeliaceae bacterium]